MKRALSSHLGVPFKAFVVGYFILAVLYWMNGQHFDWANNAVYATGLWLAYIICAVIASAISFNRNKLAPYTVEQTVTRKLGSPTVGLHLFPDKRGVFKENTIFVESGEKKSISSSYVWIDNPKELYYKLQMANEVLQALGTYEAIETLEDHNRYMKELEFMINENKPRP